MLAVAFMACAATFSARAAGPTITTQPQSQTVVAGGTASFSVVATGSPAPTYQWKKNGTNISGATNTAYTINNVQTADAATYSVLVSNSQGSVTSNGAVLTVNVAPTISAQPQSQTITVGQTASFSVTATGTPTPTYQWKKNGSSITGATSATYSKTNAQTADAGSYTVVVSNSAGTVTSSSATLTVNAAPAAPVITTQPQGQTLSVGATISLSVVATGSPAPSYQWKKDGNVISGATSASYSRSSASTGDSGNYTVVVSNSAGSVVSSAAAVSVYLPVPEITSSPSAFGMINTAFSYQIIATNYATNYAATGLPPGLSINGTTGVISGVPTQPGDTTVTITAINSYGMGTKTLYIKIFQTLPFSTDFEVSEGYTLGNLNGQLGWTVAPGSATVTNADHYSGNSSIFLAATASPPPTSVTFSFTPAYVQGIVFLDLFAKPYAGTAGPTLFSAGPSTSFRLQQSGTTGVLYANNGSVWQQTSFNAPLDANYFPVSWIRLTVRADFTRFKWDLYANGQMVAADLGVSPTGLNFSPFVVSGAGSLDDFYIGASNPLFVDSNSNGIDDAWETSHGLSLSTDNRNLSPSGSGVTVIQAYIAGTDPNDFYSGAAPTLVVGGDNQIALPGEFNAQPFSVRVSNSSGSPLTNAPVTFTVSQGGGSLATSNTGIPQLYSALALRTDTNGSVEVYYKQPQAAGAASTITATAGVTNATFHSTSAAMADSDGNGLPDAWETTNFGQTGIDPDADADNDGLTNLQEYQNGTNPNSTDSDGDGMPDGWEVSHGLDPKYNDAALDSDADGITNIQEFQQETDPADYFNGVRPQVSSPYGRAAGPNGEISMVVKRPDGTPWANAPATFTVTAGDRRISATLGGPSYSTVITVQTDSNGLATVYLEPLQQ